MLNQYLGAVQDPVLQILLTCDMKHRGYWSTTEPVQGACEATLGSVSVSVLFGLSCVSVFIYLCVGNLFVYAEDPVL